MRQREAFLQLCRPTDSASDMEDILPIQMSDSEGIYSPDPQSRNEGLITAQELVDAHIQQVEARLEANATDDRSVVAALGDGIVGHVVVETQSTKTKSESKRKKKKSSKKQNKTNGNVVNNNNNNNLNDFEEQKPLMTQQKPLMTQQKPLMTQQLKTNSNLTEEKT